VYTIVATFGFSDKSSGTIVARSAVVHMPPSPRQGAETAGSARGPSARQTSTGMAHISPVGGLGRGDVVLIVFIATTDVEPVVLLVSRFVVPMITPRVELVVISNMLKAALVVLSIPDSPDVEVDGWVKLMQERLNNEICVVRLQGIQDEGAVAFNLRNSSIPIVYVGT
jgi:hypothetical protein